MDTLKKHIISCSPKKIDLITTTDGESEYEDINDDHGVDADDDDEVTDVDNAGDGDCNDDNN